jgi:TPR repeat protein
MATADRTHGNASNGGIIRPPRRGAGRVALDLWRAGGSFRGFVEFAVIGSVILAFLPSHSDFGASGALRSLIQNQFGGSSSAPINPSPKDKLAKPGTAPELPVQDRSIPLVPRLSDLRIAPEYFDGIEEPLHGHLVAALAAYNARSFREVHEVLASDDPEDRRVMLLRGLASLGFPDSKSITAGIGMLERAAAKGEARAAAILGVLKMTGLAGYSRDLAAGREMLERAVAAGDGPAAHVLGDGYISGWAGSIDPAKAERLLRLASDRGDASATVRLAEILYMGQGVAKNQAEAERLFLKAASAGHARAQAMMGVIRLMPYSAGLTDNPDEALDWLERSAAQNDAHGMFYLGLFYMEYGERIGRLDPLRAFKLFRSCAETTYDHECVFAYATAYDLGIGTPRDPVMAYALYSVAATRGPEVKANRRRDDVGKTLSAEEKIRANVAATDFLRRIDNRVQYVGAKFQPVAKKGDDWNKQHPPVPTPLKGVAPQITDANTPREQLQPQSNPAGQQIGGVNQPGEYLRLKFKR